jgi:hypothetical protein
MLLDRKKSIKLCLLKKYNSKEVLLHNATLSDLIWYRYSERVQKNGTCFFVQSAYFTNTSQNQFTPSHPSEQANKYSLNSSYMLTKTSNSEFIIDSPEILVHHNLFSNLCHMLGPLSHIWMGLPLRQLCATISVRDFVKFRKTEAPKMHGRTERVQVTLKFVAPLRL